MISYGSQILIAETLCGKRSHQLGEGHQCGAAMPTWTHPPRLFYGSRHDCAAMPMEGRSHQLGEGQAIGAEMPSEICPSRPVYGSHLNIAAMLRSARSHQLGEPKSWHRNVTLSALPPVRGGTPVDRSNARRGPSSPPVYGSLCYHAAMPIYGRSHLFTRGQTSLAEMPRITRLSREGSPRTRRNATETTPFPTSFGPPPLRRKATPPSPNFNQRPNRVRRNAFYRTPRNQGDPIWIQDMKTRLSHK